MILAIKYQIDEKPFEATYGQTSACLAVQNLRTLQLTQFPWGTTSSDPAFPAGPAIHLDHIRNNQYDSLSPAPVRIGCDALLVHRRDGNQEWVEVERKFREPAVRGVMMRHENQRRAYILIRSADIIEDIGRDWQFIRVSLEQKHLQKYP